MRNWHWGDGSHARTIQARHLARVGEMKPSEQEGEHLNKFPSQEKYRGLWSNEMHLHVAIMGIPAVSPKTAPPRSPTTQAAIQSIRALAGLRTNLPLSKPQLLQLSKLCCAVTLDFSSEWVCMPPTNTVHEQYGWAHGLTKRRCHPVIGRVHGHSQYLHVWKDVHVLLLGFGFSLFCI